MPQMFKDNWGSILTIVLLVVNLAFSGPLRYIWDQKSQQIENIAKATVQVNKDLSDFRTYSANTYEKTADAQQARQEIWARIRQISDRLPPNGKG